jgi:hypothetical protein
VTFFHGYGKFAGKAAEGYQVEVRRNADRQARHHRHRLERPPLPGAPSTTTDRRNDGALAIGPCRRSWA